MPNWSDLAKALCDQLYPASDGERREAAMREAQATSGFLRLAQEFEAEFGRIALNERIRALVPDADYDPDDLHRRLLTLPWSDVFTTNWDTILERACRDVFDRAYDVIRTVSEIPVAIRPRIVKLHGSFPAHEPFIFTEEDYRT
jgi:SIR2-like domain